MGPFPGNWLAARIADLTPDLQVLLSCGSTVVSFHSRQSFSVSFFHVCLGLPAPRLPSICISYAVLIAPLERATCPNQRSLRSLKMRSRSSSWSFASSSLDLTLATSSGLILQICLFMALSMKFQLLKKGAQWLSGRVLKSRPKGRALEPHQRHCVVVLEQDTFILA